MTALDVMPENLDDALYTASCMAGRWEAGRAYLCILKSPVGESWRVVSGEEVGALEAGGWRVAYTVVRGKG